MVLALKVPTNLEYFKGHFPQAPILPGVVQLHWAVEYSQKLLKQPELVVKDIEVLKFQVVIVPEQELTLTIRKKSEHKFQFVYQSSRGQHASGRVVVE